MTRRRFVVTLCCALGAGCGGEVTATDAEAPEDRPGDVVSGPPDGSTAADVDLRDRGMAGDGPEAAVAPVDVAVDDRAVDVDGPEGGRADAVVVPPDRPALDAGVDVAAFDLGAVDVRGADARAPDASTMDGPVDAAMRDVPSSDGARDVADAGDSSVTDVRTADVGSDVPRDAPVVDAACAGPGPVITVVSPTSGQVVETCSASGAPVHFAFTAAVAASAPVIAVNARWVTPDGAEAPPPAALFAAPYVFSRQVGGPSAGVPALSVFGLRGAWRVEFTALDGCGRRVTASQSFSLTFTPRRCPKP